MRILDGNGLIAHTIGVTVLSQERNYGEPLSRLGYCHQLKNEMVIIVVASRNMGDVNEAIC